MIAEKVAVITAGGSGMGAAAAKRLAQDGFKVAILSSSGKGEALAKTLGGLGLTGSNQSSDDLKRIVDLVMAAWGRVDVLVNSAGHGPRAPLLDITDEQWHLGLDVYFLNVVRAARLAERSSWFLSDAPPAPSPTCVNVQFYKHHQTQHMTNSPRRRTA